MAEDFAKAVDDGLKLSKRIYFGKDRAVAPPRPLPQMEKSSAHDYLPTAPMVYAVISDPGIVDNPDIPSYQPHVHGRCDPPALIPLQMNGIELVVNCYLDTAFVRVIGSWRVHCVMGSRSCDCRVAVPMGDQGSILGVEVDVPRKSYYTELIAVQDNKHVERVARDEDGGFLKPHIFTLTIPQIDGGTNLSIRLSWSQKLSYKDGQFSVNVPFRFPEYVTPAVKKISKKEKIQLNVDAGTGTEVLCKTSSHPLKEIRRHVGKLGFLYEAEVLAWSNSDFNFSYTVSSTDVFGGLLLQSPSIHDVDQRETFCIYLMPGSQENRKVFRKEVIFVVDISGSMNGKPLEDMKSALSAALFGLSSEDLFNIMAFNGETYLFSTSMELATNEAVDRANEWISINFIAEGGTNILPPLDKMVSSKLQKKTNIHCLPCTRNIHCLHCGRWNEYTSFLDKAVEMLSNTRGSVPMIFLVTDGAVEDERHICDVMKSRLTNGGSICPRIYTFGIGSFCNNYFLQTLATISGGHHEAAYDVGTIEIQLQRLFTRALCTVLTNITIHGFEDLNKVEVYPSRIPDLSSVSPLIVSGCYQGKFPDNLTVKGLKGDLTNCIVDLKIQSAKDIPIDRVLAKQKIDLLTAQAWFSDDKQLQEKVAKISIQTGFPSEYTTMALLEEVKVRKATEPAGAKRMSNKSDPEKVVELKNLRKILLYSLGIGFGDITATTENIPPGYGEAKLPDAAEMFIKAASNCCGRMCSHCCCMCCIQCCTKINDQCAIAFTQLCAALACFGCAECCSAICCPGEDGH